jgi:prolyl-tRNA editing enzyme YbaK/EbsC (Cys-tRNA(Pro) deacylase)
VHANVERVAAALRAAGFGGVAPVGHPAALTTVIDRHLAGFDVIWAAAPQTVFASTYDELIRLTAATPADVASDG